MKKILVIILFCAVLVLPTAVWFACGGNSLDTFDTMKEKRNPTEFPAVGLLFGDGGDSSDFFAQVESWFEDRLPFRTVMNTLYTEARDMTAKTYTLAVTDVFNAFHTHSFDLTEKAEATCTEDGYIRTKCLCGEIGDVTVLRALGHNYTDTVVKATCTEGGYTSHLCLNCGDTFTDGQTQPEAHAYVAVEVPAGCTTEGYTTYTCSVCGQSYDDNFTPATGHLFTDTDIPATCTTGGFTTHVCSVCGLSYDDNYTPVSSHTPVVSAVVKATCTEGGYTTYTCSVCGYTYNGDYTQTSSHTYGEWTTVRAATTSSTGEKQRVCSVCGKTETETLPVIYEEHTHTYETETVDATCTEGGYTTYTCSVCGDSYRDAITPAKGHTLRDEVTAATCRAGGYTTHLCTVCGYTYTDSETPLAAHTYRDEITLPTCTAEGYTVHTCTVCGISYTDGKTSVTAHTYRDEMISPTCKSVGYTVHTCTVCDYTYTDSETPLAAHTYRDEITLPTCTAGGYTVHTCTVCGKTYTDSETSAVAHTYRDDVTSATCTTEGYTVHTCTVCGASYTDAYISALGHTYGPLTETVAATCETPGRTQQVCDRCGFIREGDVVPALGHDFTEWTTVIEATTTAEGERQRTCKRCQLTETSALAKVIESHTHSYTKKTVSATCTKNGYTYYICSCGDRYDGEVIKAGHNYEYTETTATCTEAGYKIYTCTVCGGTKREDAEALGHNYKKSKTVTVTCTTDGYDLYICTRCNGERKDNIVRTTNEHTWGNWVITRQTTALVEGERIRVCQFCGLQQVEAIEKLHKHSYVEKTVDATCTVDGYTYFECECGDRYEGKIIKAAHNYEYTETTATCTEAGVNTYTCTVCKGTKQESAAPLGHTYEKTKTVDVTCLTDGYDLYVCSRCGDERKDNVVKAKNEHTWGDWVVTKQATEQADGEQERVCQACGERQTQTVAKLHNHVYTEKTVPATCTVDGYTYFECSCGDRYDGKVIQASHNYVYTSTTATCETAGVNIYTCTVCKGTKQETAAATGHDYAEQTVTPATCTVNGSATYVCSKCQNVKNSVLPMTGHTYVKQKTVAANCAAQGYDLMKCSGCGTERKENYTAKTTTHTWGDWNTVTVSTLTTEGKRKRTCTVCGTEQTETVAKLVKGALTANGFAIGGAIDTTFNRATAHVYTPDGYNVINDANNWVNFTGDSNYSCVNDLTGAGLYSTAQKKAFADRLQKVSDACAAHGKTLVFTVGPNKSNIYSEYMIGTRSSVQRVDQLMQYLEKNTTVKVVWTDALDEMFSYKETYELYFRYDSHWNAAGGFVWANNILRALGLPYTSLYDVQMTVKNRSQIPTSSAIKDNLIGTSLWGIDQTGDLRYSQSGQYAKDDTDFIINYLPDVTYNITTYINSRNNYSNNPEYTGITATTTSSNKQKCVVIGDSFRRALNPVLIKNFSTYSSYFYTDMTKTACVDAIHNADVIIIEVTERLVDLDKVELFASFDLLGELEYLLDN